ncbi:MAG TPA: type II toxin-antitoxin system Phd/YefM family antitoxin [Thermomicrobiales bacterium]|jgi:prevent-host-death family protein
MAKTISTEEARTTFDEVVAAVQQGHQSVVLVQNGKPVAAVIPVDEYERYRQARLEQAWATVDRIQERNADLDPDEILAEVTAEVEAVRRERRTSREHAREAEVVAGRR